MVCETGRVCTPKMSLQVSTPWGLIRFFLFSRLGVVVLAESESQLWVLRDPQVLSTIISFMKSQELVHFC
jgi:hypothetical protein